MAQGKYIIVLERGHEVTILFDSLISHDSFRRLYANDIISAGFFSVFSGVIDDQIKVAVWGRSISLDLGVREHIDNEIIRKFITNELMY